MDETRSQGVDSAREQRYWLGTILIGLLLPCASIACQSTKTPLAVQPSARSGVASPKPPELPAQSAARESQTEEALPALFPELVTRAAALATNPPRDPQKIALPSDLAGLRYDAYRSIRFKPEKSFWRDASLPFEAQFFHPGFSYQEAVTLFEVTSAGAREIPFSSDLFAYDLVPVPPPGARLGFVGFRLHTALNQSDYKDELVVFQGASYFRPLGRSTVYGLSARGLAVNLGGSRAEEFPRFSEFYLHRPDPKDHGMWVLALLESKSVTGAYAFRLEPGDPTVVEITAEIFPRSEDAEVGLAPLSSMYLFGEEGPSRFGDFRPEVHDSDGLSLWLSDGEWLFRPLRNPTRTTVCTFRADRLRGFGLLQRDRKFESYQDLEARYEARPSLWIEPLAGFEDGAVRLLEIATELETDDNIAVAFQPDRGGSRSLRYRIHVGDASAKAPPGAIVHSTRLAKTKEGTRFVVDFTGGAAEGPQGGRTAELVLTASGAQVLEQHVERHPLIEGYRASFELEAPKTNPKANPDVELRAFLRQGGETISETWSYLWQPIPRERL